MRTRALGPILVATSDIEGRFTFSHMDTFPAFVWTQVDGSPRAEVQVTPGDEQAVLIIEEGASISGHVRSRDGSSVPASTVIVTQRVGLREEFVTTRSVIDPEGAFELRVRPGDYVVTASAPGRATSAPTAVRVSTTGASLDLVLPAGGEVSGVVRTIEGAPIPNARVVLDGPRYGSSVLPAHIRSVTRADGRFTLAGVTPGRVAVSVLAAGHHPRTVGGIVVTDHATIGPLDVTLTRLEEGERPTLEAVGIGVQYTTTEKGLEIYRVFSESGAEAAGLASGDMILGIDGVAVESTGEAGARTQLLGADGTTVRLQVLKKDGRNADVVVTRRPIRNAL